jgi:hypothetical protein
MLSFRSTAFAAAAVAAALTAGPAAAKDFCVGDGAGCSGSVQEAVDAAAASPGHDRVLIGPGAWSGTVVVTGDIEIEGSGAPTEIVGSPAIRVQGGTVALRRARLVGSGGSVVSAQSGALTIRDALIDGRFGIGPAVTAASGSVDIESVTLLGAGQQAIDARAFNPSDHVTVSVRDSVVSGFGAHALSRAGAGVANLSLDYADVFPASDVTQQAAGTLTANAVMHVDPRFAGDGITPMAGSPLIDAATPGAFGAGELDLLGNARLRAFGCDAARRDIGAVEATGSCQMQRHRSLRLRYVRREGRYALRVGLTAL